MTAQAQPQVALATSPGDSPLVRETLRQILMAPVYDVARHTDLSPLNKLSARLGTRVWLKREDQQPVHSFKLRGAFNKLHTLTAEQKAAGVVAASAGNHAQGVAMAAKRAGIRAVILMPTTTPEIKVQAVQSHGGEVVLHGSSFDEAYAEAMRLAEVEGLTLVPPFDDAAVIAGQGTVAQELLQQKRDLDMVFVPVGGGGLIAGMAAYIKALAPNVRVIGVEPEDAACLQAALVADQPVTLERVGLFADGVAVKRIGTAPFELARLCVDEVITVNSDEICAAVQDIYEDTRAIAEPAGALSVAGLKRYCQLNAIGPEQKLAAVLSGANINFHSLRYVSERCELGEGKEAVLAVTIPERQGAFLQFCRLLGQRSITEFNYRLSGRDRASVFVGIRLKQHEELAAICHSLTEAGYPHQDLSGDETAKLHVRYMVGGVPPEPLSERLYQLEFPEQPGALERFLTQLGDRWNISLFHYRNHGAASGRVLLGLEVDEADRAALTARLDSLQMDCREVTDSPAYRFFLRKG
ncbi:threonine ammonia-lyase, biosynthetic [Ferrimonas marina]|uniref:L-threonine dehydratase n=1 Tax=Ferrimonas marina TaxID=299255 RepID=A0A1M5XTR3_9GAMM|nr:threonine ammonia-lyase, biosynthetic [Ferrimonas marina]SHI03215.1 threonine dehydratase [Ferrimonas marina]